jgi:tetratricopeptide (TPR) repeat protein
VAHGDHALRLTKLTPPESTRSALTLSELYEALGDLAPARERLEAALHDDPLATPVRERLTVLYREGGDWLRLAELLESGARYHDSPREQADVLCEAAAIHLERRSDPSRALDLLKAALDLAPDDEQLRLSVGDALNAAGRTSEAVAHFETCLEAFGDRRPKKRAVVHQKLSRALLHQGNRTRGLEELKRAADICPGEPRLLYDLARLAMREELLELAESTYRALALVLHQSSEHDLDFGRAEIFLDLREIAGQRGDPGRDSGFHRPGRTASSSGPRGPSLPAGSACCSARARRA